MVRDGYKHYTANEKEMDVGLGGMMVATGDQKHMWLRK